MRFDPITQPLHMENFSVFHAGADYEQVVIEYDKPIHSHLSLTRGEAMQLRNWLNKAFPNDTEGKST